MTIDEAIARLNQEKKAGIKSVIVAWWDAGMFGRIDDEAWEHAAEVVERKHDWSSTHEDLQMTLDLYTSE
jgi:hypothetical protein